MLKDELPEIVTGTVPGPKAKELLDRRNAAVPKALCGSTYPICIARGEGAMIEDLDGNKFLDWIGGVGVLNMGYSRPEVVEAVKEQAGKYFHTIFNVVVHDGYVALAEKFNQTIPCRGDKKKTYFANSGAEADENAIKVAKAYTGRPNVVCFSGAFHGRTNLTMALTAKKAYSLGMGPFPSGIYRADYPYLYRAPKGYTEEEAIKYYIDKIYKLFDESTPASDVACMIIEPIQGEGGFVPAPIEWVKAVRKICDDNGILMIADEVTAEPDVISHQNIGQRPVQNLTLYQQPSQWVQVCQSVQSRRAKKSWIRFRPERSAVHIAATLFHVPQPIR